MDKVVADFTAATKRAAAAGFLLAEVHAAHGYLAHEFLSPALQPPHRRVRRQPRQPRPLPARNHPRRPRQPSPPISPSGSASPPPTGSKAASPSKTPSSSPRLVKAEGIDLIDVSSGGNDPRQQIPIGPGYQVAFADRIRREAGIATGAVGMITEPAQADQIIRTGQADVVLLARELLRDPYWPLRAAEQLHQPGSWPVQYERAATRQSSPPPTPQGLVVSSQLHSSLPDQREGHAKQ